MSKSLIVYFSHNKENYFSGNIVNLEKGISIAGAKVRNNLNSANV